jgi:predicted DNA-binding transcriptional regulator AlpA
METTPSLKTINQFCHANGISRSFWYALQKQGLGPRIIKVGHKTLVAPEDEIAWRERHKTP